MIEVYLTLYPRSVFVNFFNHETNYLTYKYENTNIYAISDEKTYQIHSNKGNNNEFKSLLWWND